MNALQARLETALGVRVSTPESFASGNTGMLWHCHTADGRDCIVKAGNGTPSLTIEGEMLQYLRQHSDLPVPEVYYRSDMLLVMALLPDDGRLSPTAEAELGNMVARLHQVSAEHYGFAHDTLIGPLTQPNLWRNGWHRFFGEQRLLVMARQVVEAGVTDAGLIRQVEALLPRLPELLGPPAPPSLLHGDLWRGNILTWKDTISGVIDPAIYYGDPEIELAFATLFGSVSEAFFAAYQSVQPLRPGFFDTRRDIYNLYPLLVHARLFGGSYIRQAAAILSQYT